MSVDDRIVNMKFNNKQFEDGATSTMSVLDKLKASLNFTGAKQSIDELSGAAKGLNLGSMGDGVDGVAQRFSALGVLAVGALLNIGAKAVDTGITMLKALTLDPVMDGFNEYELKMSSIQTILANTARYGTQLPEVTAALDDLNTYADKTIYNFGDMTRNIGLFTNAGIGVNDATSMIKGFSNAAAASGTNAQGAASAAYQLSQALSAGKITLMDWRSLTNVGMGNKNMQDGVLSLATAMGTFEGTGTDATTAAKDFNGSLEKGWLKADVMSNYLKIMAGDMDAAGMAALGLSQDQIKGFIDSAATAEDAATKVRTWTQLYGTLKEAVGSSWTDTFGMVIGDFTQATDLFTGISDTLGGVIGKMGDARNALVKGWVDLGGRDDLLNVGKNIWQSLSNVIAPIQKAWEKIFPSDGGAGLKGFTGALSKISGVFVSLTSGLSKLQPVFEVLFGVFKLGWDVVKGLMGVLTNMFLMLGGVGIGGVTGLVGGFAALIAKVIAFIDQTHGIQRFFAIITSLQQETLAPMLDFFNRIAAAVKLLANGDKAGFLSGIKDSVQAFAPLSTALSDGLDRLAGLLVFVQRKMTNAGYSGNAAFRMISEGITKVVGYLSNLASGFSGVADILTKGDFSGSAGTFGFQEDSKVVDFLFNVRDALLGVKDTTDAVTTSVGNASAKVQGIAGGAGENAISLWTRLADAFKAVGTYLKPAIDKVGAALAWIGAQIKKVVSDLSGQDMLALANTGLFMMAYLQISKFMKAFKEMFEAASGSFKNVGEVFETLNGNLKAMQNEIKANIILKIAAAIGLLAVAVWLLAKVDTAGLIKATAAIAIMMKMLMMAVSSFTDSISAEKTGKIIALGVTLMLIAGSILVLSAALKVFAGMSLEELAKGVITLALILEILSKALDAMPAESMVKNAAALVILAGAMLLMAGAIKVFALMDIGTVAEGLAYMAGALLIMVKAIDMMPTESVLKNAFAVAVLSASLLLLAGVIKIFAAFDAGAFAGALVKVGASLLVLSVGMALMQNAMNGAIALGVVSLSLMVLARALATIGALDTGTIIKALAVMAGVVLIFAGLAYILAPIIPVLLLLGIAVALLGGAMLMAATGMLLFAVAFTMLGVAGLTGAAGFTAAMMAILELIPLLMQQLGLGLRAFAVVISESGPEIVAALDTLVLSMLTSIQNRAPDWGDTFVILMMTFLEAVQIVGPKYIETVTVLIKALVNAIVAMQVFFLNAGMKLLLGLIQGFDNNMSRIISAGTDLIVHFIEGMGKAGVRIANAALTTLLSFLTGLTTAINNNSQKINDAGWDLAEAIVSGISKGLMGGVTRVWNGAKALVDKIPLAIRKVLGIASPSKVTTKLGEQTADGVVVGLANMGKAVYDAATSTGDQAVQGMKKGLSNDVGIASKDLNLNPVIKPVLDLSDIKAGANKLDSMLTTQPITVDTSTASAQAIATSNQDAQDAANANPVAAKGDFTFIQNNTSPVALSDADIYRNTKNQLSKVKEELPV